MTDTCPSKCLLRRQVPVAEGPTVSVIIRGDLSEAFLLSCHRSDNRASKKRARRREDELTWRSRIGGNMGGVVAASSEPDAMREGSRERRSIRSEVEGSLKMPMMESGIRWSLPLLYFTSSAVETQSREGEGNREKLPARLRLRVAMGWGLSQ